MAVEELRVVGTDIDHLCVEQPVIVHGARYLFEGVVQRTREDALTIWQEALRALPFECAPGVVSADAVDLASDGGNGLVEIPDLGGDPREIACLQFFPSRHLHSVERGVENRQALAQPAIGVGDAGCESACNFGSDSVLMTLWQRVALVSQKKSMPWAKPSDYRALYLAASLSLAPPVRPARR
jgi:hypothetical protein